MTESPFETYDIEDWLEEVMALARTKIEEISFLHPGQKCGCYDKLIREIELEKNA